MAAMSANSNRSSSQNPCQCAADSCHSRTRLHHASSHGTYTLRQPYNFSRDVSSQWKPIQNSNSFTRSNFAKFECLFFNWFLSLTLRVNANLLMRKHSTKCHLLLTPVKWLTLTISASNQLQAIANYWNCKRYVKFLSIIYRLAV